MSIYDTALPIAVSIIKGFEGCCLRAYPDSASPLSKALSSRNLLAKYKRGEVGIPDDLRGLSGAPFSIGYGETEGVVEGMIWTQEQATERLQARVKGFMQGVLKASPKLSTQAPEALASLTSLCYNIGEHAYVNSTVAKKIAVEDWQGAANAILMWNRAGGQVVDGLVNRRKAESEMFLKAFEKPVSVPKVDRPVVAEKPVVIEKNKEGSIMDKIMALLNLFRKGKQVANPAAWKLGQVTSTAVAVAIMAAVQVAKAFGIDLGVDDGLATTIGAVLVGIGNIVVTVISSKRAGLPVAPEQTGTDVHEAPEPEAAQPVQNESQPDVAAAVTAIAGGVESWLQAAHANSGQRRTEDSSYYGT